MGRKRGNGGQERKKRKHSSESCSHITKFTTPGVSNKATTKLDENFPFYICQERKVVATAAGIDIPFGTFLALHSAFLVVCKLKNLGAFCFASNHLLRSLHGESGKRENGVSIRVLAFSLEWGGGTARVCLSGYELTARLLAGRQTEMVVEHERSERSLEDVVVPRTSMFGMCFGCIHRFSQVVCWVARSPPSSCCWSSASGCHTHPNLAVLSKKESSKMDDSSHRYQFTVIYPDSVVTCPPAPNLPVLNPPLIAQPNQS